VLSVVSAPQIQRRWWASSGNGAWTGRSLLKATRCTVSDVRRLEDASLSYSSLRGWDGFILDNWFSGNGRAGFAARHENASITFTANRVEWNHEENMLVTGGDGYQITGNFFDRAGTCGLALRRSNLPCRQFTITGNFFKRSGKLANPDSHDSSQILLEGSHGVTCTGNNFEGGRDDGGHGVWSPSYGIVHGGLADCVVTNNVLNEGSLRELFLDVGGQSENAVIHDNPGRLLTPR